MSTTADEVRTCVRRDPVLAESLARDVASQAKLARWLQRERGIQGTEQAIISAIRRMDAVQPEDASDEAREAARQLDLEIEEGKAALVIRVDENLQKRLARLRPALGGEVPVLPGRDTLTLLVDADDVAAALEAVGRDVLEEERSDLVLVTLERGDEAEGTSAALLGLVSQRLGTQGVPIESVHTTRGTIRFLVPERERRAARDAILSLIDGVS